MVSADATKEPGGAPQTDLYDLAPSDGWRMFQNGPAHAGLSIYDTTANQGKRKAILPLGDSALSTPAVAGNGTVYVLDDKYLYAIGADGALTWSFSVPFATSSDPVIGADGTIYVAAGNIYAVTPDGRQRWVAGDKGPHISNSFFYTPILGPDGIIYALTYDHTLYAINSDGVEQWHFHEYDPVFSTANIPAGVNESNVIPALGPHKQIYYLSSNFVLISLSLDGNVQWRYYVGQPFVASPTVGADGTVYMCQERTLLAIHPDGDLAWSYNVTDQIFTPAAIGPNNVIYFGSGQFLYSLSPWEKLNWKADLAEVAATEYDVREALREPNTQVMGRTVAGHSANYDYYDCVNQARQAELERQQALAALWAEKHRRVDPTIAIGAEGTVHLYYHRSVVAVKQDGAAKWSYCVEGDASGSGSHRPVHSGPVIGPHGTIYIGSEDGILHTIDRGIPMPPKNLGLSLGNRTVTLNWHPPCDDNGAPVKRYDIYSMADPPGARPPELIGFVDGNTNTFMDEHPLWGQAMQYEVESVNAIGSSPRINAHTETDPAAPKVHIQWPAEDGIVIGNAVRTEGIVEDGTGISLVRVSLNGTVWSNATGMMSWAELLVLSSGRYTLFVEATDLGGRTGLDIVHFYVDTELPTLKILDPQECHTYTRTTAMMSGIATDDIGIARVEVSLDNLNWERATITSKDHWNYELHLAGGMRMIYVRATDLANRSVVKVVDITVSLDDAGPKGPHGGGFDVTYLVLALVILLVAIPVAQCLKVCMDLAEDKQRPVPEEPQMRVVRRQRAYHVRSPFLDKLPDLPTPPIPDEVSAEKIDVKSENGPDG